MSDQYAMMMGLDLTDEERMRMLADSLRGKQEAADFFALSTVPNISGAATARGEELKDTAERVGVLKNALADRQSREEQDELNRQNRLQAADRGFGSGRLKYVQPMRDADGNLRMIGYRNGEPVDVTPEGMTPKPLTESNMGSLLERADKRMAPTLELTNAVEELDNLLENHAGGDPRSIPGLTFREKLPGIGGVFRLTRDAYTGKGEAGMIYSATRGVINTIIRNQAGLTQTNRELQNVREQTGMDALSDPQVFLANLDRIKTALEKDLMRMRTSMSPAVVDQIESEYAEVGMQSPFAHRFRRHSWEQPRGGADTFLDGLTDVLTDKAPETGPKPVSEMTEEEILRELNGG